MAVSEIKNPGTYQIKNGPGFLRGIFCEFISALGTIQVRDGPDPNGNFVNIIGGSPCTPPAVGQLFEPETTYSFQYGLSVIIATSGAYSIQYD